MSLRQACSTWQVPGHPGLHSEILSKENKGARTADAGGWAGEMVQQVKHLLDRPDIQSSIPTSDGRRKETNSPELIFGFHYSTKTFASALTEDTALTHSNCNAKEMQNILSIPSTVILMIGHQVVKSRRDIKGQVWVTERNCPGKEEEGQSKETIGLMSV